MATNTNDAEEKARLANEKAASMSAKAMAAATEAKEATDRARTLQRKLDVRILVPIEPLETQGSAGLIPKCTIVTVGRMLRLPSHRGRRLPKKKSF